MDEPGARSEPGPSELERELARLRATVALHERTIKRQEAELSALRARAGEGSGADPSPPASIPDEPAADGREVARPVAGADYTVVFDGGALGNPGRGYGSYQIVGGRGGGVVAQSRREYGDNVTNNQAEYRTLIHALEDLTARLGPEAGRAVVAVRGDSQLVIQQVTGRWKVKHAEIRPLHARAVALLGAFGRVDVAWHGRAQSVRVLGH